MENSKIKPNERKYIRQKIAALKKNTNQFGDNHGV
jgi:hypothetical protein